MAESTPQFETTAPQSILPDPLAVGEPDVSGPLAVFPLFAPSPAQLEYTSFSRAHAGGEIAVNELSGGASVNDLTVHNQHDKAVLLYEGEELLGAQQNRVLDIAVLVAAKAKTHIPVSCVEQGRWDGRRHREGFRPSRQAADPELRKLKNRRVRERAAAGAQARADQGEVWQQVESRSADLNAPSPTAAMSDVYEQRRDHLSELRDPIQLHEGQCGAVCAIDGRISILDYVGRPDVWADLHPALLEGYALDALRLSARESLDASSPPELATVRGFTLLAGDTPADGRPAEAGLGATIRFAAGGVAGSALVATPNDLGGPGGEELVQLTAYPEEGAEAAGPRGRSATGRRPRPRTRVDRPSRRRRS